MAFQLKDTQNLDLEVTGVTDKKGNPTSVENGSWSIFGTDAVLSATEGNSTQVQSGSALGSVVVTYTADADLGDGVSPISGSFDIEIVAGDAAIVNIQAGEVTEQA